MSNFKSFGKKFSVPFFPGFTAITGPNGSGKSNIVDAILFVLGPRSSKEIRAEKLTDLIFNGGKDSKKPAKECKVSLVFDNTERKMPIDSDEVKLTRVIKRAPLKNDSENYYSRFYINDRAAKYSEFVDLLKHARISSDGYNIVKQGDVTSIIEMGPVDRRKIIDEIAGISEFDRDVEKAEREKEEVDENLERIKIILNEVSSQIRHLKKDRDEAYRYKELKDKFYEIKAKIAVKKKHDIKDQISEINQQINSYQREQNSLNEKSEKIKAEHEKLQQELEEIEKNIAEVGGDEIKEIKEKINKTREAEIKTEEKINYVNEKIKDLQREKEENKIRLEQVTQELQKYNLEITKLTEEINERQTVLEEKEKNLLDVKKEIAETDDHTVEITYELMRKREEYKDKQNKIHELELLLDRHSEKFEVLEKQVAELQEKKSNLEFEIKDINWQIKEYDKEEKEKHQQLKKLGEKLFNKKKQLSELSEHFKELEKEIRKLQIKKSKLEAEYEASQMIQSRYNTAVNRLLEARDRGEINGIHGTIAELADVDEKYKTALEIAAGRRMLSIVVENDKVAAEAIRFLQSNKLGRATFLPLNKMLPGKPSGKALMVVKDPSSHGFAIDLIDFKKEYRNAFWYVFGDTIVVESLNDARRLMGGVRLVDLKGSLIEASGAIKGGSPPKSRFSFKKIEKNELMEVTKKLQSVINTRETLGEEIDVLKQEINDFEEKIRVLNETDHKLRIKKLEVNRKEIEEKIKLVAEEIENKKNEINKIVEKKNLIDAKINEYQNKIDEIEKIKEEKGQLLAKTTKKTLAEKQRFLEEEISKLQDEIFYKNSEKQGLEKKIELVNERKKDIAKKLENNNKDFIENKKLIDELKNERGVLRNQINTLMKVEEKMSSKIKELAVTRDTLYKKTVSLENELDKINTRIESYFDLLSRAKYKLPALEESLKEIEEELKLYNVEIKDEANLPSVDSLKKSLKVTEENMRELEPVNMRALEEYEHQVDRKKEMDEDIKRLKNQKKNLEKLVHEVTNKKKERFYEVFEEINSNFKKIYHSLSDGGEGELIVQNPENVFESGLTIKARPRGKKVLLLSSLSGGEKSIASLAFIFAIQQYDPSPFYVLDEIDMFLDGVNAENVSRMVKNNSQDSQFIMVTLRKIALKEADHIYGVTMKGTGVSEMIADVNPEAVGPKGELKTPLLEVKTSAA